LRVGTGEQVGTDFDAIANEIVIDFNFVGGENGIDHDDIARRWFDRDGAVRIIDGDSSLGSDIEAKVFVSLSYHSPGQQSADDHELDCAPGHKIPRCPSWSAQRQELAVENCLHYGKERSIAKSKSMAFS
jgi:hypothetical protein